MVAGLEVIKHMLDNTLLINQEADAMEPIKDFTHGFRSPDTKSLRNAMILIAKQGEVQALFLLEVFQPTTGIGANTQHQGVQLREFGLRIP